MNTAKAEPGKMRGSLLFAALALVVLGNLAVLGRVAYNRSGEPETWTFTERELRIRRHLHPVRESSGVILRLAWHGSPPAAPDEAWPWNGRRTVEVGAERLEALGFPSQFDCARDERRRRHRDHVQRRAWIALEYDGPAYRRYVEALEARLATRQRETGEPPPERQRALETLRDRLERVRSSESRLYAVDVAPERSTLARHDTEGNRRLILPATVTPWLQCEHPVSVHVRSILTAEVNVPRAYRAALAGGDGYHATIAYGRVAEPWLVDLQRRDGGASGPRADPAAPGR